MHLLHLFIKLNNKTSFPLILSHPEDEPPLMVRNVDQQVT